MAAAAIAVARARLVAALPGWADASDNPHPQPTDALPLFHVRLSLAGSEPVATDDPRDWLDGSLIVMARAAVAPGASSDAVMHAHAATIRAALLAPNRDLGGTVWEIRPDATDIETDTANARVATAEISFAVTLLE